MLANLDFTGYKEATVFLPLSTKGHSKTRSWIGVILFLFFFTLPLHFHSVTDSQQISQECSCQCGGLSQLGSTPAPVVLSLAYQAFFIPVRRTEFSAAIIFESESARGPPLSSL
jgi:hypothetical protein